MDGRQSVRVSSNALAAFASVVSFVFIIISMRPGPFVSPLGRQNFSFSLARFVFVLEVLSFISPCVCFDTDCALLQVAVDQVRLFFIWTPLIECWSRKRKGEEQIL